jgi:hypothetical protein
MTSFENENDGNLELVDDLGIPITYGDQLKQLAVPAEKSDSIKEPGYFPLGAIERAVLSFNRHPIIETTASAVALTGIGFLLGSATFAHRRRRPALAWPL